MVAVDTNVVVRLLTADDPKQHAAAQAVFSNGPVWIAKTVLLETCWVLRSLYGFEAAAIHNALAKLLGLRNVQAEDGPAVAATLSLAHHGIDFAEALHLSSRPAGAAFVSFDRTLVRRAQRSGVAHVAPAVR
jgi:predicted nucleic-acid-binding protein